VGTRLGACREAWLFWLRLACAWRCDEGCAAALRDLLRAAVGPVLEAPGDRYRRQTSASSFALTWEFPHPTLASVLTDESIYLIVYGTVIALHPQGRAGKTEPLGQPEDTKRDLYSKVDIIYLIRRCLYPSLDHSLWLLSLGSIWYHAYVYRKSIIKGNPFDKDRCGGLLHRTMKASRDLKMHNPTSGLARTGVVCF